MVRPVKVRELEKGKGEGQAEKIDTPCWFKDNLGCKRWGKLDLHTELQEQVNSRPRWCVCVWYVCVCGGGGVPIGCSARG